MSLIMPKQAHGDFELVPAETHLAVCYRVIDLGTQAGTYQGQPTEPKRKIMIGWEFPEARMKDGRPFSLHNPYTFSSSKKATLRKHLEAWRGKPFTDDELGSFDIGKLIRAGCLINVIHNPGEDTTYANIGAIMKLPKGTVVPALINEPVYFSLNAFDQNIFNGLSENLKKTISNSPEYKALMGKNEVLGQDAIPHGGDDMAQDVPF